MIVRLFLLGIILRPSAKCGAGHDYGDALSKAILFFEGQRSGRLPEDQRVEWRGDSALADGQSANTDLTGGYYDAGDNIKFGFPMAFSTTMLAWSVVEFGSLMTSSDLQHCLFAIRWATDYLLKTISSPNRIFVQVGDAIRDHNCWERPEDMDTPRTVYQIDFPTPASDLAAETAAALAASSLALRSSDTGYSDKLLSNAIQIFKLADQHRGAYSSDPLITNVTCPFYCDIDGYQDELLWATTWLWKASSKKEYVDYIDNNSYAFGALENIYEFGWENKHAGLIVLLSKEFVRGNWGWLQSYKSSAESFICAVLQQSPSYNVTRTPGGLIYKAAASNLQHVTSYSFLLLAYANYVELLSSQIVNCSGKTFDASSLRREAKRQVDYILGDNPMNLSYMVGYGNQFPKRIHHRGSSLPSIKIHPEHISCQNDSTYFNSQDANPNLLVGAVVGGPGIDDSYADDRSDYQKSEPTTYINAPFVGVLAYFAANPDLS